MKKIALFCLTVFTLFSCNQDTASTKKESVKVAVELPKSQTVSTVPARTMQEMQMDSVYESTVKIIDSFVHEYKDDDYGIDDVWWDSKKPNDQPFNRIRLCQSTGDALIIERRRVKPNANLEVLGYLIDKDYRKDSTFIYFIESSRFMKNEEVSKDRKRHNVTNLEEMIIATEIFRTRLQEARNNIAILNGKQENQQAIRSLGKNG